MEQGDKDQRLVLVLDVAPLLDGGGEPLVCLEDIPAVLVHLSEEFCRFFSAGSFIAYSFEYTVPVQENASWTGHYERERVPIWVSGCLHPKKNLCKVENGT